MVSLGQLFRMNYMTILIQTIVLVVWVFIAFPMLIGFGGWSFNVADPYMFGASMFTGLMVSGMTFLILKNRRIYA